MDEIIMTIIIDYAINTLAIPLVLFKVNSRRYNKNLRSS